MVNIGEQLITPEEGWQRIDDSDGHIKYDSTFSVYHNGGNYNGSEHGSSTINSSIEFFFYGSKIRLINFRHPNRSSDIDVYIDDIIYGKSVQKGNVGSYIVSFQKLDLTKTVHKVKLLNNTSEYLTLDAIDIDENGKLLSQEEYIKEYIKTMSYYIKQNNKYYSFSKDNYDTENKMYKEITLDDMNNNLYQAQLTDLTKEITIGEETFKPIDKFDNFQFVSKYNVPKTIIGRKSKTGMSIASGDIYTKVASRINSFTLDNTVNNNSYIKMAVSFDNGATWKTYKDNSFSDLNITIANKTYEDMTVDEKNNWKSAKETILSEGFAPDILSTIDFNTINDLSTIRFAYVLYQDLINDNCGVNKLSWNFNVAGSFQKMTSDEVITQFSNGVIKIIPKANYNMIITNYVY